MNKLTDPGEIDNTRWAYLKVINQGTYRRVGFRRVGQPMGGPAVLEGFGIASCHG